MTENKRTRSALGAQGQAILPGVSYGLSEMARDLQDLIGSDAVMEGIVAAAVREIPGTAGAGITLFHRGKISSPVHSDERAREVGLAEKRLVEGPCVDTSREEITIRSDDLRSDPRWPRWGAAAAEHGVISALSIQLFVEADSMGALNLYGDQPNAFDEESENTALLLAAHAAVAMASAYKIENLKVALGSRDVIGKAKGILMERFKIDADQAFALLVMSSQATHRKLRDVATNLTETGELALPAQHGPAQRTQ